jgi:hypothetical protein
MVDPRPDLTHDAKLWVTVLMAAVDDPKLYWLLHGLRCGGARLTRKPNGALKLNYKPLLSSWDEDELLRDWLMPQRTKIAQLFRKVREATRSETMAS